MTFIHNLRISLKITLLLLAMGAITLTVAVNGVMALRSSDDTYTRLISTKMVPAIRLSQANRRVLEMGLRSYQVIAYGADTPMGRDAAAEELASFNQAMVRIKEVGLVDPSQKTVVDGFVTRLRRLHASCQAAIAAAQRKDIAAARAILVSVDRRSQQMRSEMIPYSNRQIEFSQTESDGVTDRMHATAWKMMLTALLGILAGIGAALALTRSSITGPLTRLRDQMGRYAAGHYAEEVGDTDRKDEVGAMARTVRVFRENGIAKAAVDAEKAARDAEQHMVVDTVSSHLSRLSDGDLSSPIAATFPPDYEALKRNFNEALDKLRGLIGAVSDGAVAIRSGSGEIAQAAEDLARRTEGNASSLEQTASAITQMDERLKATADAAGRTVNRADQAITTVGGGRVVADEAVQAMGRVSESAKGIDSVIEGLDKIAFQTRVLAMNAAVESGRAGDAGRGFAVVADLVSALAMRSEEEAKRAREQLTATQADIVTAVEAVQKVDGALSAISGDVTEVHGLLAIIATDNQAQAAAITQVASTISSMDRSTQQNAAMVEETSAAARNLASETAHLADQAARFDTGGASMARRFEGPVRPLPAEALPSLVRARQPVSAQGGDDGEDWASF
ncbi:methyl-accepting chemotaxis protein [Sphingomonas sp. S-NIH.Pt15_0812]|uniref:methyl-accepting chemotaxis protein n=1 Tax=Sphingomonas sp. S-NIH.Pt15_0812 TaxID=1920129 RepID=UPI000F7ED7BD|nr:methyl-accepting chemotaxis protein [Sphingomonas sp. S-NIH.Pt15_0812]RSU54679.1 methyl-accepting chemotaxis protein [Sphingomonas sp. S-NIH.Pt15_0812]